MRLIDRITGRDPAGEESRNFSTGISLDQLAEMLAYNGQQYPLWGLQQTWNANPVEDISSSFASFSNQAYMGNGPVFSLEARRMQVFSEARLAFRRVRSGRPGGLFTTDALARFQNPWPGGTTGDLLRRMMLHADLAGNWFGVVEDDQIVTLRPDWVSILLGQRERRLGWELIGYRYDPGGPGSGEEPVLLTPDEVAHFAPYPDPMATYRGMSWLTPVIREIQSDGAATVHKQKFYENAAPQPLDAKILTPTGWSTMGDMAVGDEVVGSDGRPHTVTGVFPQGERDIYRVRFGDGTSTECTLDHVWTVSNAYDRKLGRTRTMSLEQMIDVGFRYDSGPAKWAVPMVDPVDYSADPDLPIDPYLMGLLLGDGSFRGNGRGSGGVSMSTAAADADEIVGLIEPVLPDGVSISRRHRGGWEEFYFRGRGGPVPNPFTGAVKALKLFDVAGGDKFIPAPYLVGSVKDRVALLQGLVDSDGNIGPSVRYTTTSVDLARGLVELVGSLGGAATISPNRGRTTLTVTIRQLPDWIVPARLLRKAAAYRPSSATRVRTVIGAELVGRADTQCIAVDTEDHLYVTDEFVVTHNTPNMAVTLDKAVTPDQFREFDELFRDKYEGNLNAYKTMLLGGGADVTVVGADMKQLDFKATQGAGETRLAAAAGIHPVVAFFSEGMSGSSLNAGNFAAARRATADMTFRPLWRDAVASLSNIADVPGDAELWYDDRDIAFLRDDGKQEADIFASRMAAIRTGVDGGFVPESVVAAADAMDVTLLEHTDLLSVQLLPPGQQGEPTASGDDDNEKSKARELAEIVQKIYLGVGVVLSADEARAIVSEAGAVLPPGFVPTGRPQTFGE